ncbi:MAG TPA: Fe-Mn family superoxide dismutase [Candidatus Paceibacterota bacterium]|nr:Fe-Mn family superoxide dismutase [Candidatus Paceibacterota bacterium]
MPQDPYVEKKFNIPELKGISKKTIEEHLKLYAGYVKNTNLIMKIQADYGETEDEGGKFSLAEVRRRFAFEFNGMRNHEYYFEQFEGGPMAASAGGAFYKSIVDQFGSFEKWLEGFKQIAMTRGIGWANLYLDQRTGKILNHWIDEQHLGHLNSLRFLLGLDMWEHSYLFDYTPADKKKYVEAFFENLNWGVVEDRFEKAI